MANWFDPGSSAVRAVLTAVMLGSLLMAAALPEAFGERGLLFAASDVALRVGRNAAAASLLKRRHRLRDVFERLVVWSAGSGVLWLAGAALDTDQRLALWIPALALVLAAPAAGYWLPGRGRATTTDYDIEGTHFAERCQLFIIIALGESIVVTGATASAAGLTSTVVLCLVVAFVETAALWWLYFGATAEHARVTMSTCDDPGRLARDGYTYLHLPIVAGIIGTAVANDLLIGHSTTAASSQCSRTCAPTDAPRRSRDVTGDPKSAQSAPLSRAETSSPTGSGPSTSLRGYFPGGATALRSGRRRPRPQTRAAIRHDASRRMTRGPHDLRLSRRRVSRARGHAMLSLLREIAALADDKDRLAPLEMS
jgi:hypothetical protein